jgi:hypothetical protein
MNLGLQLISLTLIIGLNACGTSKTVIQTDELKTVEIASDSRLVMNRGACHGRCPIYSLIVEYPGKASYIGKRFTDKLGLYEKTIPDSVFQLLMKSCEEAELWQYDDFYPSATTDLAVVELLYSRKGETKSIKGTNSRPEAVLKLENQLVTIAEADGWVKLEEQGDDTGINKSQIIIRTKEKIVLTKWVRKYSDYRLMFKDRRSNGEWLVSWDIEKISGDDLLKILLDDPEIISAFFESKE